MAKGKKSKSTKSRSTEWQIGQPLAFPVHKGLDKAAHDAVEEGLRGPFKTKRSKQK